MSHASGRRWQIIGCALVMAAGLLVFSRDIGYRVQLVGLALFFIAALLRPRLALAFVIGSAPFYLIPAQLGGLRQGLTFVAVHEAALLTTLAATVVRATVGPKHSTRLDSRVRNASALQRGWQARGSALALRWYLPHILLLIAATATLLLATPEGIGAARREWLRLIILPVLWYGLLRVGGLPALRSAAAGLVVGAGLVAGIGVLQAIGLDLVPLIGVRQGFGTGTVETGGLLRIASVYGHPNNLGLLLERALPFALAAVLLWRGAPRAAASILALLVVGGIGVSLSRGAWLASAAAVLALAWGWLAVQRTRPQIGRLLVIGGVLVAALGPVLLLRGAAGGSADARVLLWRETLAYIGQQPLGLGMDQFYYHHNPEFGRSAIDAALIGTSEQFAAHPHNLLLDTWANVGPLGLVAFGWLTWRILRWSVVRLRTGPNLLILGAFAACVAALAHGLVDRWYFVPDLALVFWLLVAIAEGSELDYA